MNYARTLLTANLNDDRFYIIKNSCYKNTLLSFYNNENFSIDSPYKFIGYFQIWQHIHGGQPLLCDTLTKFDGHVFLGYRYRWNGYFLRLQ